MSDLKFACPICGQHITAESTTSGQQLECPTCFQKIVVPQAPESGESKLILSAARAEKHRPRAFKALSGAGPIRRSPLRRSLSLAGLLLVLICLGSAAFVLWRGKIARRSAMLTAATTNAITQETNVVATASLYPIPTNFTWTLVITNAVIPEATVAGSIRGNGFLCERATLQGGILSLRQGKTWPPDLGITVLLAARQGEDLSGKTIVIPPGRNPPVPRVLLRWKDEQQKPVTEQIHDGYALKVVFGQATNGQMPGRIYISLPDSDKSFAAGTFEAEIRKPQPPKPRSSTIAKNPTP